MTEETWKKKKMEKKSYCFRNTSTRCGTLYRIQVHLGPCSNVRLLLAKYLVFFRKNTIFPFHTQTNEEKKTLSIYIFDSLLHDQRNKGGYGAFNEEKKMYWVEAGILIFSRYLSVLWASFSNHKLEKNRMRSQFFFSNMDSK